MSKSLFLLLMIAWIAAPFNIYAVTAVQQGNASGDAGQTDEAVVNIIVESMDKNFIYAKDGSQYAINSDVKIIHNTHSRTKMKIAELHFKGGRLMSVIIK